MTSENFEKVVKSTLDKCVDTMVVKAKEYATEDRLHNFRVAAKLQGITEKQALVGMMAKHSVSIYDMCRSGTYTKAQWDEKIGDHINYLLLLMAIVEDEQEVTF